MAEWREIENPSKPRVAIVGDRYYSSNRKNWADVVAVDWLPHNGGEDWRVQFRYHFESCLSWGGIGFSLATPTIIHLISDDGGVFFVGSNVAYEGSLYVLYGPGGNRIASRRFSTVEIFRAAISQSGDVCCYLTGSCSDPEYDSVLVALSCSDGSELYRFKVGSEWNVPLMPDVHSVNASGVEFDVGGSIVAVDTEGSVVHG